MTRDPDLDALAEAIRETQGVRRVTLPHALAIGLGRLGVRLLVKAAPFALFAVAASILLARTGVDLGWLLMAMFYGTPLIVAAVVGFVVHAWRQNRGLTWTAPVGHMDLAEPGQVGHAEVGQANQPDLASPTSHLARPAQPVTVTATVRDLPKTELPRAVGQDRAVYYPTDATQVEEDTDA